MRRQKAAALYLSSHGNYFFIEIRNLFAAALADLGWKVELRDENRGYARGVDLHFVVAPHEFYFLGAGEALARRPLPARTVLYNTEQPSSQWYARAASMFPKAAQVWDIDQPSVVTAVKHGANARFIPLGYSAKSELFALRAMPRIAVTESLPAAVFATPPRDWAQRPIDIFFAGTQTPRRDRFFAQAARVLARHKAVLHFADCARPICGTANGDLTSDAAIALAQRSKIVLNVHRDQARYFEWHRMVLHGLGQGALVVSEPVSTGSPLRGGRDFVEAELGKLPELIDGLLSSQTRMREGAAIAAAGRKRLQRRLRLADWIEPALRDLFTVARRPLPRLAAGRSARPLKAPKARTVLSMGTGRPPGISVAVSLHDYAERIGECLDSVAAQTLQDLDLIIVDDGSSDTSLLTAKKWLMRHGKRFNRALLLAHDRCGGLAAARNCGFAAARSERVFVLDADNRIYPRCLERLAQALNESSAQFAYSSFHRFGEEDGLMNTRPWDAAAFNQGNYIDAMALIERSVWSQLGGYRAQGVQGWEDFDFWLRLARMGGHGVHVSEILAAYRVHLSSMLHRETNPNAAKLENHFRSTYGVAFKEEANKDEPSGETPAERMRRFAAAELLVSARKERA
jgi:GT2 family glycosyltransferase